MKTKSALSYFGSDSEVAPRLAELLDHCSHVTIPFCGGMSILPFLKARAIVANDLNDLAINFYRVMSGVHGTASRSWCIQRCKKTLSHPGELTMASGLLKIDPAWPPDHRAWAYWAQCWIGRKGKGGTDGEVSAPSVRRKPDGGTNASRIKAAAADLEEWAKHFERCEWECRDFRELFPEIADDKRCGIYVDGPWVQTGDKYIHKFAPIEDESRQSFFFDNSERLPTHKELAECCGRFEKTTVVIRYGDHPRLREYYPEPRWTWIEASSRTQSNAVKGEVWITRNVPGTL